MWGSISKSISNKRSSLFILKWSWGLLIFLMWDRQWSLGLGVGAFNIYYTDIQTSKSNFICRLVKIVSQTSSCSILFYYVTLMVTACISSLALAFRWEENLTTLRSPTCFLQRGIVCFLLTSVLCFTCLNFSIYVFVGLMRKCTFSQLQIDGRMKRQLDTLSNFLNKGLRAMFNVGQNPTSNHKVLGWCQFNAIEYMASFL